MPSKVRTAAIVGLEGRLVTVEADTVPNLPKVVVVGLPDTAVGESRERVRSAIRNSGFEFPHQQVTINLSPADLPKSGASYDLAIALAVLALHPDYEHLSRLAAEAIIVGEVALSGEVLPTRGAIAFGRLAAQQPGRTLYAPAANAGEAALIPGVSVFPVRHFSELVQALLGQRRLRPAARLALKADGPMPTGDDLSAVAGQAQAKRALEIAASGGHNLLLSGPPGSGKTMLARCLPALMPPLSLDEQLEVSTIYSVAGLLRPDQPLISQRPFRSPHHTASAASLVGGGSTPKPGELTLAHRGVLFLDEFAEFPRPVLEALRQPLEDRRVTVARVRASYTYPADALVLAALNPCPCGYATDPHHPCRCSPISRQRYQRRLSGPLLDRFDLRVEVPPVERAALLSTSTAEPSAAVRQRVLAARARQAERYGSAIRCNAELTPTLLRQHCQLDAQTQRLAERALDSLHLSARSYHRLLKVSRTIADLASSENIQADHFAEALQYRGQGDS